MKFLSRVVWSEGKHLGPHHFQTQSHVEDTLRFLNSNLRQEPWGFLHYSLDIEALRNGLAILCSAGGVVKLVKRALSGLELMHQPVPPAALHAHADMHYFPTSLSRACWQHILQTKQVGVYEPGDLGDATFELTIITETSA
jgi:predicted component of type VI protein secretion system